MANQANKTHVLLAATLVTTVALSVLIYLKTNKDNKNRDVESFTSQDRNNKKQRERPIVNKRSEDREKISEERAKQLMQHKRTVGILDDSCSNPQFIMDEIGVIRSNFPHRAGTPRQGTLAPHARSHLVLHPSIAPGALEGLEQFSHLWIVFRFHINVNSEKKTEKAHKTQSEGGQGGTKYSAKVRPPRAGGKKVGVFSTRTPHRPNPIGLSLCEIEYIDLKTRTISVLGLDLVDFTPVYDIKPYIPWDSVHYAPLSATTATVTAAANNTASLLSIPRVPEWVTDDETIQIVKWSQEAKDSVTAARLKGILSPLFPPPLSSKKNKKSNKKDTIVEQNKAITTTMSTAAAADDDDDDDDDAPDDNAMGTKTDQHIVDEESSLCEVCRAIGEVIAQDPRAIHHGRGTTTTGQEDYSMTFNTLRVYFQVLEQGEEIGTTTTPAMPATGGGDGGGGGGVCKTWAYVTSVMEDPGDITAAEGSYQHSVSLRKEAEENAMKRNIKTPLPWKYPVREGVVKDLFLLRTGQVFQRELTPLKIFP